ncbi:hypothetical protein B0H11DRAFT_1979502 [Mycena galericulata]|nr:hypothetical protein B0H11DRAFT_1979502 [Mycena galericulata]
MYQHNDHRYPAESASALSNPADASSPHGGGFFQGAQQFVIAGGNFINNSPKPSPSLASDFERFPLGDLDLLREIRLVSERSGLVYRQEGRVRVRRIYSARIEGRKMAMTAAVYQGENAEENWKIDLEKHSLIRHPNFFQLFGTVSSERWGVYALVFHGELVPVRRYIQGYLDSPLSVVYLYSSCTRQLEDAAQVLHSIVGDQAWTIINFESATWIRSSTGQLYVEPSASDTDSPIHRVLGAGRLPSTPMPNLHGNRENAIISSLTLVQFYEICHFYLKTSWSETTHDPIRLGGIMLWLAQKNEIAHLPNLPVIDHNFTDDEKPVVTANGWTRVPVSWTKRGGISRKVEPDIVHFGIDHCWLSQANYIFRQYPITANYDKYTAVSSIEYLLTFLDTWETHPTLEIHLEGYLFPCPLDGLKSEDGAFIEPECLGYWSPDAYGWEIVWTTSWNELVYAGLRQFHDGKGFNPYSQGVALHLEYPLYELSRSSNLPGARIEEVLTDSVIENER